MHRLLLFAVLALAAAPTFPLAVADLPARVLFSPQANQLDAYDLTVEPPVRSLFVPRGADGGKDLNGMVCALPLGSHILLGEDTDQADGVPQGWGVFELATGTQVGKLIATYGSTPQPEPYGCAIDNVGSALRRVFATQVGSGDFQTPDGQLLVFFEDSPSLDAPLGRRTAEEVCPGGDCSGLTAADSRFCVLDPDLRTAGGIVMDSDGSLYVTEAAPQGFLPGRVLRYAPPFPDSADDCFTVEPATFIQSPLAATPVGIARARDGAGTYTGHWYVSSVLAPPVVNEYDGDGLFVRTVLPPGFGTPFGLAVDSLGVLYVADLGLNWDPRRIPDDPARLGIDTAEGEGSVLRVSLGGLPELVQDGLTFPDGLGVVG